MSQQDTSLTYTDDGGALITLPSGYNPSEPRDGYTNLMDSIITDDEISYPSYYNESDLLNGRDFLNEMGRVCVSEFKDDLVSRDEWDKNAAQMVKLFTGFMDDKSWPWDNCSNVNLPFITIAVLQFHARVYESLLPPKNICQIDKTGFEDTLPAERVEKYMNWQILHNIPNFEYYQDKTLLLVPIVGCAFKKTFYNAVTRKKESRLVPASDFVVNYGAESLEECNRQSQILYLSRNDIRKRVNAGLFIKEAWSLPLGSISSLSQLKTELDKMKDKVSGQSDSRKDGDKTLTRVFIEQHREWDINKDGIAEDVIIYVDYETEKVVRIIHNEYKDEYEESQKINTFTEYGFLPNPNGFYPIGFGTLLKGLNESGNTILNEVVDAGALANLVAGFVSKRSGIKKGDLKFEMGKFPEVDTYVDDIKKALYVFDFKGPNQTLYAVLGLLYEYSKLVSSVSETMTGAMPASDTPAQTVLALIEEGRKVFSSIHRRLHRSFKEELKKLYILNKIYFDEIEYLSVIGERSNLVTPDSIPSLNDFKSFYDLQPVSDPNIISRGEKIIKAKETYELILTNPNTSTNSKAIDEAFRRYLITIDTPDIDILLEPIEPPDLSPEDENAGIIKEKPATALETQDHIHHLQVHEELLTGPFASILTPPGTKLLEQHKQEHYAFMYLQRSQVPQPEGVYGR